MGLKESLNDHMEAESGGFVCVQNDGAFVAAFSLDYKFGGQEFHQNSGDIPVKQRKCLNIPVGAKEIQLTIKIAIFINVWSVVHRENFGVPTQECYRTTGTTLSPKCEKVNC